MQIPTGVHKVPLSGTPDEIAATLEEQSRGMALHEYMAGTRLRLLAAELAKNTGFRVSVLTYGSESQELEVSLVSNPSCNPIMIDRNNVGDRCQITFDHWLNIESQSDVEGTARLIAALLQVCES